MSKWENSPPEELVHYGIKGMKWGVRKTDPTTFTKDQRKQAKKRFNEFTRASIDSKFKTGEDLFSRKMTREEYDKLSTKDFVVRKGTTVRRVAQNKDSTSNDPTFVSFTKNDKNTYRAVMPVTNGKNPFKVGGNKTYKQHYEITFKAMETLKSPSEKERVDAFSALMDTKSITLKNGKTVTGRQYVKRLYPKEVKTLDTQQLGLRVYKDFTHSQGDVTAPINSAYFKSISAKGYNALIDDNDRGHMSEAPLIILNPNGSLKRMNVHPLSADDINQAMLDIEMPEGKEYS